MGQSQSTTTREVLAFGDSLTKGYTFDDEGMLVFTPYTDALGHLLQNVRITNAGVNGERTGSMLHRLRQHSLMTTKPAKVDTLILLGGTNDLGSVSNPETPRIVRIFLFTSVLFVLKFVTQQIADNVREMAEFAIQQALRLVVLMTLPPCRIRNAPSEANDKIDANREAANALIKKVVSDLSSSQTATKVLLVDLASHFTIEDMCDGVHFKSEKYDEVARYIQKTVFAAETPKPTDAKRSTDQPEQTSASSSAK